MDLIMVRLSAKSGRIAPVNRDIQKLMALYSLPPIGCEVDGSRKASYVGIQTIAMRETVAGQGDSTSVIIVFVMFQFPY